MDVPNKSMQSGTKKHIAAPGEYDNPPKGKGWVLALARNREHVDQVGK